ncbi:MAG: thioesterase family protein [bacterium]
MEIKVYYQDTDCGGVVYYANYLTYFERARTEFFAEKGISIKKLAEEGILFVVSHAEADYRRPAFYGEILEVNAELRKMGKTFMEISYGVREKESKRPIAAGMTTLACVDRDMKPRRLPGVISELGKNL